MAATVGGDSQREKREMELEIGVLIGDVVLRRERDQGWRGRGIQSPATHWRRRPEQLAAGGEEAPPSSLSVLGFRIRDGK